MSVVVIPPPPPELPVAPLIAVIPAGERLVRIYDPTRHQAGPLTFRRYGPLARFDHHHPREGGPEMDETRGVYYAAWAIPLGDALASCFDEVFGDRRVVVLGEHHVATPLVTRDLTLLDLRQNGAMLVGTVSAIAKCEHRLSQQWSSHFYGTYKHIDGLLYLNAHNDGPALMLYERAESALSCADEDAMRLDHPDLWPTLVRIMNDHALVDGRSGH